MTTFNLIDEPWIPMLTLDGSPRSVGIREALLLSGEFSTIAAELATVSISVQRVLQAILLRACAADLPKTPEARARLWGEWWDNGGVPVEAVEHYLETWHDHFDLLDSKKPFFQVPGIRTASGRNSGLVKLIADVPDGTRFFTTRAASGLDRVTLAEAAQWLIHAQGFDYAGIKTGIEDDGRVKGGKNYSFGYPAFSGTLGIVSIEGNTLAETLLLNLALTCTSTDDRPVWETAPQRIASDGIYPRPVGAAQAWTWPNRMIRLIVDDAGVTDVIVSNGERLEPTNLFDVEPMTSWRYSEAGSKKAGRNLYFPLTHQPGRSAWRGLSGVLAQSPEGEEHSGKAAAGLDWLAMLTDEGALPADRPVNLRCVGMVYGGQASTFDQDFDDAVPLTVATIVDEDLRWLAVEAVEVARKTVTELRKYARNVALASGVSGDALPPMVEQLSVVAYDRFRPVFEAWVSDLTISTDSDRAASQWQIGARSVAMHVAAEHARFAPASAVFGRTVRADNKTMHMDLGRAELWLRHGLKKVLPLAYQQEGSPDVRSMVDATI